MHAFPPSRSTRTAIWRRALCLGCGVALVSSGFAAGDDAIVAADEGHAAECAANLRILAHAIRSYALAHAGKPPARLSELHRDGLVLDLRPFCCPLSGRTIGDARQIDADTDYEIATTLAGKSPLRIVRDRFGYHDGYALGFYSDRKIRREPAPEPPVLAVADSGGAAETPSASGRSDSSAQTSAPAEPAPAIVATEAPSPAASAITPPPQSVSVPEPVAPGNEPAEPASSLEAQDALARQLEASQSWAAMERAAQELIRRAPQRAEFHDHLGRAAYFQRKWADAEQAWTVAARLAPREPRYALSAAAAAEQLGRFEIAEAALQTAQRVGPDYAPSHFSWGHFLFRRNRWAESAQAYTRAVNLEPRNGEYRAHLAGALHQIGQNQGALEQARYALQLGYTQHWIFARLRLAGSPTN